MNPKILDQVPWDAVMPAGPQTLLTVLSLIMFVLALWFVVAECKRRGDKMALYAFLGGGLIIVYEPLGDMLASVLYPVHGQIGWIDLFGRKIPLFIGVLYFWYMSVPGIYFVKKVEQGLTKAALWRMYFFTLVVAIGIELFGVNVDAWVYYGPHPYVLAGVPLWCPVTYSGFLMTISIGLYGMVKALDRRHQWIILFGLPICMAGGHCAVSLPAAAAMYSTDNPVWIWAGATASILLSLLLVYAAGQVYCVDGSGKAAAAR